MYWLEISAGGNALQPEIILGAIVLGVLILLFALKDSIGQFFGLIGQATLAEKTEQADQPPHPGNTFSMLIQRGNTLLAQYQLDEALVLFQEALRYRNTDASLHFKIGRIYLQKKDYKNAISAFNNTLRLNPVQIEAHYELARIYAIEEKFDAAQHELNQALAVNPDHEDSQKLKLKLYEQNRQYAEALPMLAKLAETASNPLQYQKIIADFNQKTGHLLAATEAYEALINSDPENRLYYYACIGSGQFSHGHYSEAIASFQHLFEEKSRGALPDDPEFLTLARSQMGAALCNQGVEWFEKEDFQQAIARYQEALSFDPNNPDIFYNLGKALSRINDIPEAMRHFQSAITLSPRDVSSYYELALLQDDKGQLDEAITTYEQVLALEPRHVNAHFCVGTLYGLQEDLDRCIQHLNAAVQLDPGYVDAVYNLAVAYEQKGDIPRAVQAYKRVLTLEPTHDKARSNLAHIKHTQKH